MKITDPSNPFAANTIEDPLEIPAGAGLKERVKFRRPNVEPKIQPAAILKDGVIRQDSGEEGNQVCIAFGGITANMSQLVRNHKWPFDVEQGIANDRLVSERVEQAVHSGGMKPGIDKP